MATGFSTSTAGHFEVSKDSFEYVKPLHQQFPTPSARSRGRYGSRSFERSLQHPQGCFHNPLKSLSPLAARLAQESDADVDSVGEMEDDGGVELVWVVKPDVSASLSKGWPFHKNTYTLVQDQKITTTSITRFHISIISLVQNIESWYSRNLGSAYPTLTRLSYDLERLKDCVDIPESDTERLRATISTLLKALEPAFDASAKLKEVDALPRIQKSLEDAIDLLQRRRREALSQQDELAARRNAVESPELVSRAHFHHA